MFKGSSTEKVPGQKEESSVPRMTPRGLWKEYMCITACQGSRREREREREIRGGKKSPPKKHLPGKELVLNTCQIQRWKHKAK